MSQVATWTFNPYITFLLYGNIGLTTPVSIYSQAPVFCTCQGFTKSHSGSGLNGLQPMGLKEYSDSFSSWTTLDPSWEASGW
jgi:hypothetical protein